MRSHDGRTDTYHRQLPLGLYHLVVTMEGTITGVMESSPLQLTVETSAGAVHVVLRADTAVSQDGQPIDAGRLRPNLRVCIRGERSGPGALTARSVELLT